VAVGDQYIKQADDQLVGRIQKVIFEFEKDLDFFESLFRLFHWNLQLVLAHNDRNYLTDHDSFQMGHIGLGQSQHFGKQCEEFSIFKVNDSKQVSLQQLQDTAEDSIEHELRICCLVLLFKKDLQRFRNANEELLDLGVDQ